MKRNHGKINGHLRRGSLALGFTLIACTLQAGNYDGASQVLSVDDERNQLAESVGPEIYNAAAYNRMEQEIRDSISHDRTLSEEARQVNVTVSEGVVTLKGTVMTSAELNRVIEISRESAGMTRVESQLGVGSPE